MKIAALVVAYNPNIELIKENMNSYIKFVDHLFIIDNSDRKSLRLQGFQCEEKVTLVDFKENKGIAYALNYGCKLAIQHDYSWILTFDQDSHIDGDYVDAINRFCKSDRSIMQEIGILAPLINLQTGKGNVTRCSAYEQIDVAMTSGCLVNLDAYLEVEGFDDSLFIDWVDNDFCYRLKLNGYKIIRLNNCVLQHHLGESVEYCFFNIHLFYSTNHNYIRYYYKTRNALYLSSIYRMKLPKVSFNMFRSIFTDCLKIILFEKDKIRKIRFVKRGINDYRKGQMYKIIEGL